MLISHPGQIDSYGSGAGTRLVPGPWLVTDQRPLASVFAEHFHALREAAEGVTGHAYVIAAVLGGHCVVGQAVIRWHGSHPVTLLVGRHRGAELRLKDDAALALRHLFAMLTLHEGELLLRVLDLNTGGGLDVAGVGLCGSVVVRGALALRMSVYTVFFLPAGPSMWHPTASETWGRAFAAPAVTDHRCRSSSPDLRHIHHVLPRNDGSKTGAIAILPTALIHAPGDMSSSPRPATTAKRPSPTAILSLPSSCREHTDYYLGDDEIVRGVLVGRYSRCHVPAFETFDDSVSRVHALITSVDNQPYVFDMGSTNGTVVDGCRTSCALLGATARIELGSPNYLMVWKKL